MADTSRVSRPTPFSFKPTAAAVFMAFATPGIATAQTVAAASDTTLPEVKVQTTPEGTGFRNESTRGATRTDTPLRDIPQIVNTIPQTLIRSQGATTLQEALRNVPGITYGAAEGGNLSNEVPMIRGMYAFGSIFIDGVRDIGEYNRDLFATDSVEVFKGASGLMYGRGNPTGVINQVTKTADLLPRREVGLTLGSFDTKRATADLNLPINQTTAVRLVALYEDSDSYRYPQGVEKTGIAPSLRFGIGTGTELTFSYYYLKTSDVTDYGQPVLVNTAAPYSKANPFVIFPPISPRKYYGFANYDYTDHETNVATFKFDHQFNSNLSLRNTLRWASYRRNMEATIAAANAPAGGFQPTTDLAGVTVTRQHNKARDNDDSALINQLELTWKVASGAVKHTVLGGLELSREKLDRQNYTFAGTFKDTTQPLLAPDPSTLLNYTKTPAGTPLTESDTIALYAQDQIELSKQWKAVLGVRWEHVDTDANADSRIPAGQLSRTDSLWSGRAGLIWQPTEAQSYYVSWGNAYNPSGSLGAYSATGSELAANNANTNPEKTVSYEVGSQWDFTRDIRLRAALFRNEKTDERIADPAGGVDLILAGKRRIEGVEFELAGRITNNWDVYGAIAFMDGKITDGPNAGNGTNVPDNSGSLWTVYRLGGGWEVGGGAFWSSSALATINGTPAVKLPSWTRWDATIGYVQRKYEVRLNFNNITDETYYIAAYQNGGNRVVPAVPRSTMLTLRYNFD